MLFAEDAPAQAGNPLLTFLPLILIVVAMYFLLIRPNNKRRREQMELQSRLAPGDEVRTAGGLYGTVVATDDESVTIEAAPGVELRFARAAISTVINRVETEEEETEDAEYEAEYEEEEAEPVAEEDTDTQTKPRKRRQQDR